MSTFAEGNLVSQSNQIRSPSVHFGRENLRCLGPSDQLFKGGHSQSLGHKRPSLRPVHSDQVPLGGRGQATRAWAFPRRTLPQTLSLPHYHSQVRILYVESYDIMI